jgi:hypothetical protein
MAAAAVCGLPSLFSRDPRDPLPWQAGVGRAHRARHRVPGRGPRTSVKYSCCLPCLREVHQHMQMMHNSTAPQIKHILPDSTVAGAAVLPTANVRQRMLDGHALPQLCTSLWCLLTFPPLLRQGFIRMHTDATARRARSAALPPGTVPTRRRWELDHTAGFKGDGRSAWTPQCGALPILLKRPFRAIRPLTHWPSLAENGPRLAPLLHQLTGQRGPVNMPCPQRALLRCQVHCDRVGDAGLGRVRRRDAHRHNQARVQIAQHMAFGAIHEQTPTLPPVAHLGSSTLIRRSAATPCRQVGVPSGVVTMSWACTCGATVMVAAP